MASQKRSLSGLPLDDSFDDHRLQNLQAQGTKRSARDTELYGIPKPPSVNTNAIPPVLIRRPTKPSPLAPMRKGAASYSKLSKSTTPDEVAAAEPPPTSTAADMDVDDDPTKKPAPAQAGAAANPGFPTTPAPSAGKGKQPATEDDPYELDSPMTDTAEQDLETEAQARDQQRLRDYKEQADRDYDKIAALNVTITKKDADIKKFQGEAASARASLNIVQKEKQSLLEQRNGANAAANAVEAKLANLQDVERRYQELQNEKEQYITAGQDLERQNGELQTRMHNGQQQLDQMTQALAEHEATIQALHKQIDHAEDTQHMLTETQNAHNNLTNAVDGMRVELEDTFSELGVGLTMDDYLRHIKDLQAFRVQYLRTLEESRAQSAADTDAAAAGSGAIQRDRRISLGHQLRDSDLESNGEEDDGAADNTLTGIQPPRTTQVLDFASIQTVHEQSPIAPASVPASAPVPVPAPTPAPKIELVSAATQTEPFKSPQAATTPAASSSTTTVASINSRSGQKPAGRLDQMEYVLPKGFGFVGSEDGSDDENDNDDGGEKGKDLYISSKKPSRGISRPSPPGLRTNLPWSSNSNRGSLSAGGPRSAQISALRSFSGPSTDGRYERYWPPRTQTVKLESEVQKGKEKAQEQEQEREKPKNEVKEQSTQTELLPPTTTTTSVQTIIDQPPIATITETIIRGPENLREAVTSLPLLYKFLFLLCLCITIYSFCGNVKERLSWSAANEYARVQLLDLGSSGGFGRIGTEMVVMPVFGMVEGLVGVERGVLLG